jgi:catechol 2,3-dioxygenase-like lactoylglutathione lyase family enzyme
MQKRKNRIEIMKRKETPRYNGSVFFVKDVEKSKKFYNEILGQEIEMDFGRCVSFIGGFSIWERSYAHKMMNLKIEKTSTNKNDAELYFEIKDLDLLFANLRSKKIKFIHNIIEQPWGQRCFRIYDPDSHIIEFGESMTVVIERLYDQGLTHNQIIKKSLMPIDFVLDVISRIDSVKNDKFTEDLIAPCGMNCRICIGYFGYTMNGNKRKMRCIGCKPRDKSCAFLKKYCKKLTKKELDYCYECSDFPCYHLNKIDNLYQERYNMSMIKNIKDIKSYGMKKFLKEQHIRYKCQECSGVICVHNGKCYSCGKEIEIHDIA